MNDEHIILQTMIPSMLEEMLLEEPDLLNKPVIFATAMFQQISEMEAGIDEKAVLTTEQLLELVEKAMASLVAKGVITEEFQREYLGTIRNEDWLNTFRANSVYLNRQVAVPQYHTKSWNPDLERLQGTIGDDGKCGNTIDKEELQEEFSKEVMKRYLIGGFEMSGLISYHPNNLYDIAQDLLSSEESDYSGDPRSYRRNNPLGWGASSDQATVIALAKDFTNILADIDEEANGKTGENSGTVKMNQRINLVRYIKNRSTSYEVQAAAEELLSRMGYSYEGLQAARRRIVRLIFDRILRGQPLYSDLGLALDDLKSQFRSHITALNMGFRSLVELANRQGYEIVVTA